MKRLARRLRYWLRRDERHEHLHEEMTFHMESAVRELMDAGMPEAEARVEARKRFGNVTLKQEESRETWIARWLSDAVQDLRYGLRSLRRDAGFTTFSILVVGLGIGASSTVFSVLNAVLLRPLPFRDPGSIAWIANGGADGDMSGQTTQVDHMLDLRRQSQSFSDIAGYFAFYGVGDMKLTGTGEPERLSGVPVTQNFFPLLGVAPQLGRLFNADECKWRGPNVVVLTYNLWKRRFGSDPNIVGRKLRLNDESFQVIGVMPESFDFATVFAPGSKIDLFLPFPLVPETNRQGNTLAIVGRLRPGATVQRAGAELRILAAQIVKQHPERNGFGPVVTSLEQHVSGRFRLALLVLTCAVGVVMLIVCANLSNMQLARTSTRQKEMAIRVAVGAGKFRLIRQMLTENVTLASAGAILGLLLAVAGTRVLARLTAFSIPMLDSIRLDAGTFGFTLLLAVATGLLFGLAPALQVPSIAVHDTLKDSSRGSSEGRRHGWLRGALVVSEIALACMLLVGAGLLMRSFMRLLDVDLGFHPERAATIRIDPSSQYSTQEKRNAYFDEALRLVRDIPGIEAAGITDVLPMGRNRSWGAGAKGQVYGPGEYPDAFVRIVTDGYLRSLGIPLRKGRDFTARDTKGTENVAIINETLARRLWPGQDPLGKLIDQGKDGTRVVGVVADVHHIAPDQGSGGEMYLPMRQLQDCMSIDLVVRTSLPPETLASSVRAALRPIEPNIPANEFRTLQQMVDKAVSPRRFVVMLLAGFAGFALILASLGIYGVISYSVSQRTQEIGIRMALGASPGDLQRRVLAQTMMLAGIGIAIGVVGSWVLARLIGGLLYEVKPADPLTFAVMLSVLVAVAAAAGYLPARRASQIDPMIALRAE